MKLGLGTVQFGLDYGIKGEAKAAPDEVERILARAADSGVEVLDTAPAYGDSEAVIGAALPAGKSFRIVTKTAAGPLAPAAGKEDDLITDLETSLRRLRQASVYGLLLHHGETLLKADGERIWQAMRRARDRGLVSKIGVSVYTGDALAGILARFEPDIVQAPVNVFDQRLIESGLIDRLHRSGVEFHARSVFLQGLLLMPVDRIPGHLSRFRAHIRAYREEIVGRGLTPLAAALGFVASVPGVDTMIVGANSLVQFDEILATLERGGRPDGLERFSIDDADLVDPSRWVRA